MPCTTCHMPLRINASFVFRNRGASTFFHSRMANESRKKVANTFIMSRSRRPELFGAGLDFFPMEATSVVQCVFGPFVKKNPQDGTTTAHSVRFGRTMEGGILEKLHDWRALLTPLVIGRTQTRVLRQHTPAAHVPRESALETKK